MRFLICLFFTVMSLTSTQSLLWAADSSDKELAFVNKVVLGTEYGGDGLVVSRWKQSPTLSVFGGSEEDRALITEIIGEINDLIKESGVQIKIGPVNNDRASFKVFLVSKQEFYALSQKYDLNYVEHNDGYFHLQWNGRHQLTRAIVLIRNKLKGSERRHFMYEEITQAMGLAGDSDLYRKSIFYGKPGKGGKAKGYSDLDKKLIRFFYTELNPGDGPREVLTAFQRAWLSASS